MVSFPNCKINLGLNIVRKRDDGYHDLETVFYPVALRDALEAVRGAAGTSAGVVFSSSGLPVAGEAADNFCVKAWQLLQADFAGLDAVRIHLHKTIPMGAGLGGGSADGAFTLKLLNQLGGLNLSDEQLASYALTLGSDCPFFIRNKPCVGEGRGEILREIQLDLTAYTFVIVNPGIHISTASAFSGITPREPAHRIADIIQQPVAEWKEYLQNDFEAPASRQYPEIAAVKTALYDAGAIYASMTGSGSSVYGLFAKGKTSRLALPSQYPIWRVYNNSC